MEFIKQLILLILILVIAVFMVNGIYGFMLSLGIYGAVVNLILIFMMVGKTLELMFTE